ncbi:MAG TPA: Trm112 family protein [Terrimicrobiaceae bacterium]|jgi:uncharacterized protein YbaR (Trm112 family)|nr:Trm112 family protein [Terrimicrobiaceae bacterium]
MEAFLLEIICCPLTHQSLRIADETQLTQAAVMSSKPVSAGLVRQDGRILYPIRDGIPLLAPEEGIPLS